MAYQDPRYYGSGNSPSRTPPAPPQSQQFSGHYTSAPQAAGQHAQVPLQRSPSYQAGDDSNYFDPSNNARAGGNDPYAGHSGGAAGYNGNNVQNNLGSRHSQFSVGSSQHSAISHASSQGSALSGYQHHYQPPTPSSSQPVYNPQQFAQPPPPAIQTRYNPQTFSATSVPQYASYSSQYNPAAYQPPTTSSYQLSPNSPWQSPQPYGHQSSQYPYQPVSSDSADKPLPLPPRSHDTPYSEYSSPQISSPHFSPAHSPSVSHNSTVTPISAPSSGYSSLPPPPPPRPSAYNLGVTAESPTPPTSVPPYSHPSVQSQYQQYSSGHSFHSQAPIPDLPVPSAAPSTQTIASPVSSQFTQSDSAPTPPLHQGHLSSPRRTDTLSRHPQARPLPGPPAEREGESSDDAGGYNGRMDSDPIYDDILREVEATVMEGRPASTRRHSSRNSRPVRQQPPIQEDEENNGTLTESPHPRLSPDSGQSHINGHDHISSTGTGQYVNYAAYNDDSDAEAAAGLAALQMAEEEDAAMRARSDTRTSATSSFAHHPVHEPLAPPAIRQESSSDSDYHEYDMGLYGGGYDAGMSYGETSSVTPSSERFLGTSGSLRNSQRSGDDRVGRSEYDYPSFDDGAIHPFPSTGTTARVDAAGTGGRRLSFDHGDETSLAAAQFNSNDESLGPGEPEDLFFHPGMSSRPLPPPPINSAPSNLMPHLIPAGTYVGHDNQDSYGDYGSSLHPTSVDAYYQTNAASAVPRSTSLTNHPTTPRELIIRSKTDADRIKSKQAGYDSAISTPSMAIDLPAIPAGKKFNPAKLSSDQFKKCTEPWAMSAVVSWVRELSEEENYLKEQALVDAIVALFTHKVPTMNMADAETLGERVVKNMLAAGDLVKDEEWVKFGKPTLSGVIFQITGQGCYSSRLHETAEPGRCYSHHCMRTLRKINLKAQTMEPAKKAEDWATFYKIQKTVLETHPKKEIERQNILHEIVTTEDAFMTQLDVLRTLYRDHLATCVPDIIPPKRKDRFLRDVFGKLDALKKVNEEYLLPQLKYRQKEQGPFITGFSDIFREWIRKAKTAYIEYAATFPNANYVIRREAEVNVSFKQFLNQARDNKLSQRLSWDTYLKAPITRIQRYGLLLSAVEGKMVKDSEEKSNLSQAIDEVKLVALDCDNKVGEMSKKVSLKELGAKLQLRPEMERLVKLNLEHLGREIIHQGDLQRPRTKRFNWVDTRAILFDHYFVLAKIVVNRDMTRSMKYETYDVSKLPIPMDLLILESTNDDPVMRSSMGGITTVAPPAGRAGGINQAANNERTVVTTTVLDAPKEDNIFYPFKVKHLGKSDIYVLYANSKQNRREWCEKIIEAKTKHAASLFAQNAEPFRLRVLSDSAFAYSDLAVSSKSITTRGTPLDRAIKEVEKKYEGNLSRPLPICRASINCATVFNQPNGRKMCAVGTDYGVFISEYDNPRGWRKAIGMQRITQIAVFEEFNLFLLIADKSLIAYHLDTVSPENGVAAQPDSQRRAPQKLSGNREVGFFASGRMKDRALVFYKKRDGISSTFKVLEPVLQKTSSKSRFLRRGNTDFFREYDEFYIPADSYSINLFHTSLAISTSRGIEVLTLDKKQPWSVPNLRSDQPEAQAHLTRIANRVKDLRPLGMFRLSESEFLVAFEECAVYVNKHGDVSRSVVMDFVGKAHSACLFGKFLILCHDDFVEVRNAMNGRRRQVISGKNVALLDDGGNCGNFIGANNNSAGSNFNEAASGAINGAQNGTGVSSGFNTVPRTVKICMQHPAYERSQIVVELAENEGQKD